MGAQPGRGWAPFTATSQDFKHKAIRKLPKLASTEHEPQTTIFLL